MTKIGGRWAGRAREAPEDPLLLRLLMLLVSPTEATVFLERKLLGRVAAVLVGGVVAVFAHHALHRNDDSMTGCHNDLSDEGAMRIARGIPSFNRGMTRGRVSRRDDEGRGGGRCSPRTHLAW